MTQGNSGNPFVPVHDETTDPSCQIINVISIAGNQVNMTVHDGLVGCSSIIDDNIVA